MAKSSLRHHFESKMAAAAETESTKAVANTNIQALVSGQLAQHKRNLKQVQSLQLKASLKKEYLPEYEGYIAGLLAGNSGKPDPVLPTLMLWSIDAAAYSQALSIAEYAVHHKLPMPENHARDIAGAFAEEMADAYFKNEEKPALKQLHHALDIVTECDMHDQIRAKLHKAVGYAMIAEEDLKNAVPQLQEAIKLDDNCGAKKELARINKLLETA